SGDVVFRSPTSTETNRVLLLLPFPESIVEARDVELKILDSDGQTRAPDDVVYDRKGIYCTVAIGAEQALRAELRYTAFGREQFDYALPPARRLRSVAI